VKASLDARGLRRALELTAAARAPRILDVGGGRGDLAARFAETAGSGAMATVVDLDADSVEAARRRGLEGFAGRFEDFETGDRFDLIVMLNLVEHVADPVGVLRKAESLLAPGGVVWLQTPNFRSLDARLFRERNWAGLHCPRHWVVFGDRGLRAALAAAGLDPVRVRRTQAGAFWAASLLGLRRARRSPARPGAEVRPLVRYRSFMPLAAAGAAFDFATLPFRPTSQVVVFARSGATRRATPSASASADSTVA
jgi:SAM-dependent methyltransferase